MDICVRNPRGYFPIAVNMLETYRNMIETCGAGFHPAAPCRNGCYGLCFQAWVGIFCGRAVVALRRRAVRGLRSAAGCGHGHNTTIGAPLWCSGRFRHSPGRWRPRRRTQTRFYRHAGLDERARPGPFRLEWTAQSTGEEEVLVIGQGQLLCWFDHAETELEPG
jgi:hypothetical protein